jgi:ABC-type cobalamin transport system ATPase subunit
MEQVKPSADARLGPLPRVASRDQLTLLGTYHNVKNPLLRALAGLVDALGVVQSP